MSVYITNLDEINGLKEAVAGSYIEKFGRNRTIADGATEDVWDGSTLYTFSSTTDIDSLSSSNINDSQSLEVQGLDTNWALTLQDVTLNGQTTINLATPLVRIFRIKNLGVDLQGDCYAYVNGATITSGSPDTTSDIRAKILAGVNQTNMAIYTIPSGSTGYLVKWYTTILRANGVNRISADVDIYRRSYGGSFRSTQPIGIQNNGVGQWQYEFPYPLKLAEKTDIIVKATPDGAAADISAGFTILLK